MPKTPKSPKQIAAYHHTAPASPAGASQLPPAAQGRRGVLADADLAEAGNWYVYVADSGVRWNVIAGPFETHGAACDVVPLVRQLASDHFDSYAYVYEFGTCKMVPEYTQPGILNDLINQARGLSLPVRVPQPTN